ncbi:hypothetical protein C8A01DRAFT_38909 [Parachaetomium inaequale]|uniref:F-box domain-containing protein n=1 Tax=Parachaetomium inaequale TaxID=2588326 RepID=A0AAN6PA97_9PEZI|nr:hypothetical protein C8A01DRAFT_38909 [Parachaetomium inaequale]
MAVSTSWSENLVHCPEAGHQKLPPTPPPHAALVHTPTSHGHLTTHQQTDSPILNLPNELLILITDTLDQPTLELLRRASPVFLRALPAIYPRLFSHTLQGFLPCPVRRPWTLTHSQRREVLRLVDKGGSPEPAPVAPVPDRSVTAGMAQAVGSAKAVGMPVVRCGRMLGLKKAWRYVPCPDCGRVHPPKGAVTPLSLPPPPLGGRMKS